MSRKNYLHSLSEGDSPSMSLLASSTDAPHSSSGGLQCGGGMEQVDVLDLRWFGVSGFAI